MRYVRKVGDREYDDGERCVVARPGETVAAAFVRDSEELVRAWDRIIEALQPRGAGTETEG